MSHRFHGQTSYSNAIPPRCSKKFSGLLVQVALVFVLGAQLVACGGGAGGTTNSTNAAPVTSSAIAPPSDTTPPTVSLSAPTNGATVSGSIAVSANAADNVGVVGVQFKLDGANLGAEDTTSPYSISWNTTTASNGAHTVTATARDAAGNTTTSAGVSVTVSNADTQPPSVPTNVSASAISSSQINLSWTASTDNVGVTGYKVYRNGTQIATATNTLYSNTGLSPATSYSYTVAAYDAAGNVSAQSSAATATTSALAPITGAPYITYTDILSGPNTGGENNEGTYLSIFGKNFGGTGLGSTVKVYINNVEVNNYRYLGPSNGRSDIEQITVQVGALGNPTPGVALPIKVVVNGVASNTNQTFTVNPGRMLFVDNVNGNDATAVIGDITHPFQHVQTSDTTAAAYGQLQPGDTIVMRGKGTNYTDVGNGGYFIKFMGKTGSAPTGAAGSGPITILSYPGETVNILANTSMNGAISGINRQSYPQYGAWITIADLHVEGDGAAGVVNLQIASDDWRVVNNELMSPGAASITVKAGGITGNGANEEFLGNQIHNIMGSGGESHGIYVDGDSVSVSSSGVSGARGVYDIGYNDIHDVDSGYGVQAYNDGSNGSSSTSNFHVHHNLIYSINGKSCINIADNSAAGFEVWNNICYNANNSGLRFNTTSLIGCLVYNNTFYDADLSGSYSPIQNDWNTLTASQVSFVNNIVVSSAGPSYIGGSGFGTGALSNNLWYGAGSAPSGDLSALNSNPLFVNPGTDFHLQSGSPAIGAGSSTVSGVLIDTYDVVALPVPPDIGAL
ncbi:MAG: Ig-like domain-containing protein [Sulfuricaulis sp.]